MNKPFPVPLVVDTLPELTYVPRDTPEVVSGPTDVFFNGQYLGRAERCYVWCDVGGFLKKISFHSPEGLPGHD